MFLYTYTCSFNCFLFKGNVEYRLDILRSISIIVGRYLLHTPLDITGYPPQQQSISGRYHITSDNIWWYKLKSEDIWWYQKISEHIYIRWYLRISDNIENIRWYLRISDGTWWYQSISDDIWGYQRISVDIWGYHRISKDIWGYQRISLDVWSDIIYFHLKSSYILRYSQISPDISDIWGYQRYFLISPDSLL